ncbi:hypothetical protein E4V01_17020 [Methylorubrum sp. Q1]|uniref:hypothetical protein n=1 Tax=Methylorubrum sp. Q1 TaxID=2562453 RepID=UPI001076B1CA|nr:hypothetical protein [Methylorubrum sp. Q1]TFZ57051.1 hypothetical protein E4V01_17020 [Methylorubrum sp. Q1]
MIIWSMSFLVNVVAALTLSGIPSVAAAIISSFWPGLIIYADDRRLREKGANGLIGFLALILLFATVMLPAFWIGLLYIKYTN